eukprot:CAMPEP_0116898518 /NCGR_PEP_ID=MMETSP0467-20121206/7233_1 /TAXON_ID=283647 /ORGANISM="Mesodinium pulex, Strain SPMC105" /LENGTH=41 /DNA_ID= /DNA_START= /DNA_END= /DNA_ORIENTATION=
MSLSLKVGIKHKEVKVEGLLAWYYTKVNLFTVCLLEQLALV